MIFPTKFLHTRFRVDDLDRTVAFYRDVLGLKEIDRKVSPRGSKLVFMSLPGTDALLELSEYKASGPVTVQPDLTHLAARRTIGGKAREPTPAARRFVPVPIRILRVPFLTV